VKKTRSAGYRRETHVKAETKREIVAAQDQELQTKILNTETDSKYRFCQQFEETIDRIISACPILAKEQYIKNILVCMCAQLHFNIWKETAVQLDKKHWHEHVPK